MNQKLSKEFSARTTDDSSTNADEKHVSPAIGNTNVGSRFSYGDRIIWDSGFGYEFGVFLSDGDDFMHDSYKIDLTTGICQGVTYRSKNEVKPRSVELQIELNYKYIFINKKLLSRETVEFFEHISNPHSEWFFRQGFWYKGGYKSRTTQELFEYYLECKSRGQNGC